MPALNMGRTITLAMARPILRAARKLATVGPRVLVYEADECGNCRICIGLRRGNAKLIPAVRKTGERGMISHGSMAAVKKTR